MFLYQHIHKHRGDIYDIIQEEITVDTIISGGLSIFCIHFSYNLCIFADINF